MEPSGSVISFVSRDRNLFPVLEYQFQFLYLPATTTLPKEKEIHSRLANIEIELLFHSFGRSPSWNRACVSIFISFAC